VPWKTRDVSLGNGRGTIFTSLGDVLGWVTLAGLIVFSVYQAINDGQAKKSVKS
jgi:hypothetical protein